LAIAIVQVTTGTAIAGAVMITGIETTSGEKIAGGGMNLPAHADGTIVGLMSGATVKAGTIATIVADHRAEVIPALVVRVTTDIITKITP